MELTVAQKYSLACNCAEGMAYLSSLHFVHRDLAARNVLVGSDIQAKIADFGLSREIGEDDQYYQSKNGQLPIRWTAPEALENRKFSEKSDCWSFGVLLYEIFTSAELPYKGMNNQKVWTEVVAGYRLPYPPGCPTKAYEIMEQCWRAPDDRPDFKELLRWLEVLTTSSGGTIKKSHRKQPGEPEYLEPQPVVYFNDGPLQVQFVPPPLREPSGGDSPRPSPTIERPRLDSVGRTRPYSKEDQKPPSPSRPAPSFVPQSLVVASQAQPEPSSGNYIDIVAQEWPSTPTIQQDSNLVIDDYGKFTQPSPASEDDIVEFYM
jgi:serine/threonine protein kinase